MSNYIAVALTFVGALWIASTAVAQTAGSFRPPFDPSKIWSACSSKGYKRDQYVYQWYDAVKKYHLGEDWNGVCGSSTDKGATIYSIADGTVVNLSNITTKDSYGKTVHARYTLPDGKQIDVLYVHLNSINTSLEKDKPISRGQSVGTLGDANAYYPNAAHLHFEGRLDTALATRTNPYTAPLTISQALKYTSPSLLADDRKNVQVTTLKSSAWTYFYASPYTPSSSSYIKASDGQLYSIRRAIDAGIIAANIYYYDGAWKEYQDVNAIFFKPGVQHAVWSRASGASLNTFAPVHSDDNRNDRARLDMIRAMSEAGIFSSVAMEKFNPSANSDADWEYRSVEAASSLGQTIMWHITNKANRLQRMTTYYNPQAGQWSDWKNIDPNRLY